MFEAVKPVAITRESADYPELLKQIPDPPEMLWVKGNVACLTSPLLTVVGTRKMTGYGRQAVSAMLRKPVMCGLTIVSGLALGIDGAAHRAALEFGGKTIGVLAQGLTSMYPRSHAALADMILQSGGAIISEFEVSRPGEKYLFLRRNRILAGLSSATLVVEAGVPSGSLITAHLSAEYGRTVMAVPGPFHHPFSEGTKKLVNLGAELVTSGEDVIQGSGFFEMMQHHCSGMADHIQDSEGMSVTSAVSIETEIVRVLRSYEVLELLQLQEELHCPMDHLLNALTTMEVRGSIERTVDGYRLVEV